MYIAGAGCGEAAALGQRGGELWRGDAVQWWTHLSGAACCVVMHLMHGPGFGKATVLQCGAQDLAPLLCGLGRTLRDGPGPGGVVWYTGWCLVWRGVVWLTTMWCGIEDITQSVVCVQPPVVRSSSDHLDPKCT